MAYIQDERMDAYLKEGWDTVREHLTGSSDFTMASDSVFVFLISADASIRYTPSSLAPSTAHIVITGDTTTLTVLLLGIPDTNFRCLNFSNASLAAIPEGSSESGFDTILNTTDSTAIIDSITLYRGDSSAFAFQFPSFPTKIAPHSSLLFGVGFTVPTPALKTYYDAGFTIWDHGTSPDGFPCSSVTGGSYGQLLVPWDTILLELPPTGSDTLTFDVHAAITGHYLLFRNAMAKSIFLEGAWITDTAKYASFQDHNGLNCVFLYQGKYFCFDDSLKAGAWSDTAQIMMQVPDSGIYPIDLLVYYVDAIDTQRYTIRAHYILPANESVQISPVPPVADFALNPNPARGDVTISLPDGVNSTIEIYDLLGQLVMRRQASGSFVWNGESGTGELAPDGPYIVRIRKVNARGQTATASKRLMFIR